MLILYHFLIKIHKTCPFFQSAICFRAFAEIPLLLVKPHTLPRSNSLYRYFILTFISTYATGHITHHAKTVTAFRPSFKQTRLRKLLNIRPKNRLEIITPCSSTKSLLQMRPLLGRNLTKQNTGHNYGHIKQIICCVVINDKYLNARERQQQLKDPSTAVNKNPQELGCKARENGRSRLVRC